MIKLNIRQKIFITILASLFSLAILLGWIIWDSLTNMLREDLINRGNNIAIHISETSSDYILFDDNYAVHQLISETHQLNEDVRYIMILDSSGAVYEHTFPDFLPKGITNAHTYSDDNTSNTKSISSDEGTIQDIIVPIEDGEVGYVRIGMSEEQANQYIFSKMIELLIVTLVVALVATGIAYIISRRITSPIQRLVHVASGISAGDLSLRVKNIKKDEVGELASTFNEMADNLINSHNQIDTLLKELQEKEKLRSKLILKLLSVQEDERRRISRELHDETSQALTSLMVTMRVLANEAKDEEQQQLLYTSRDIAADILRQIRDLAVDLRPPILDNMGIVSAVKTYVKDFNEKYDVDTFFYTSVTEIKEIDDNATLAIYRIVQESLNNVIKHTEATKVEVTLTIEDNHIKLIITDNGQGIKETDFMKAQAQNRIGIHGMKERVEVQGGSFSIQTNQQGGTEIIVTLPLQ
ncbi:sensor histidine kinase [Oceanobacillus jeddahense]|uniref:histidine kinase n=1 Tax=Oceanobacillus jeddahense TaxID=1462527 RepID=A0ABY5JXU0_9BACI|nr:sensor histidine kinase [Oceanobacillus jeddahense]UUI04624.1 HAMP domain-containing protein [Oceanobacillus jeddahense]